MDSKDDEETKYCLANYQNIILAYYKMITHLSLFDLETRKKIITSFKELVQLKNIDQKSDLLVCFSKKANLPALVGHLIATGVQDDSMLGSASKLLKLLANSRVVSIDEGNIQGVLREQLVHQHPAPVRRQ